MITIENLVKKFLEEEKLTLRNALAYAGLGLSKTGGKINGIVTDIAFNGHAYNEERKDQVADLLGEMYFDWLILAGSCGYTPDEIYQRYVHIYLNKEKQAEAEELLEDLEKTEAQASALAMVKHIKTRDVRVFDKLQHVKTNEGQHTQV